MSKIKEKISNKKLQELLDWTPFPSQQKVIEDDGKKKVLACGRRWGKALDINTDILTTDGFAKLSEVKVGDYIFGDDGKPARVNKKSEVYYDRECYRVLFSDGSEIIADASHDWVVESKRYRKNISRTPLTTVKKEKKTTEELAKDYLFIRKDGRKEHNYSIPTTEPLELPKKELPIEPYFLGLWLGDGDNKGVGITTVDREVVAYLEEYAERLGGRTRITTDTRNSVLGVFITRGENLQSKLRKLDLLNNKHIPQMFLLASKEQRMELLRGLMDSDGCINYVERNCEYSTKDAKLAKDVYVLLSTLGIKATVGEYDSFLYEKKVGLRHRVKFSTDLEVFSLPRKKEQIKKKRKTDIFRRFIIKVEKVKTRPVQCLSVDNQSHLFLAGRSLISTHNTTLCAYEATKTLLEPNAIVWIVAPSYEQTKRVYDETTKFLAKLFPPEEGEFTPRARPVPNITTNWGSKLECKTADNPTSLLGGEVDLIIMDEAAVIDDRIYYQFVIPVTHDRDADIFLISTPRGKNWFYKEWLKGGYQFPSWDRPSFPEKEVEQIKQDTPRELVKQEYEAQFVDAASSVFSTTHLENCMFEFDHQIKNEYHYTVGVDLAMHYDYFATAVYCHDTQSVVHVEKKTLDWMGQKERIRELHGKYNWAKCIVDTTGVGSPIYNELFNEGIFVEDYHFTNITKRRLVDKLKSRIEQEQLSIQQHDDLYNELTSFTVVITDAGNASYSAPRGLHDDMVDALALAVWDADQVSPAPQQEQARRRKPRRHKKSHI